MRIQPFFPKAYLGSKRSIQKVVTWLRFRAIWKKWKRIQKLPSTYKENLIKYLNRPQFSLDVLSNLSNHLIMPLFPLLFFFHFFIICWTIMSPWYFAISTQPGYFCLWNSFTWTPCNSCSSLFTSKYILGVKFTFSSFCVKFFEKRS